MAVVTTHFLDFTRQLRVIRVKGEESAFFARDPVRPYRCVELDVCARDLFDRFQTWCAQKGNVYLESVRACASFPWEVETNLKRLVSFVCDERFPRLPMRRELVGYADGVFDVDAERFAPLSETPSRPSYVARKYYDVDFDPRAETPEWDRLAAAALADEEARPWFEALLGRLLFAVDRFDRWRATLAVEGDEAVVGALLRLVSRLFSRRGVATMDDARPRASLPVDAQLLVLRATDAFFARKAITRAALKAMNEGETVVPARRRRGGGPSSDLVRWRTPLLLALPPARSASSASREDYARVVARFVLRAPATPIDVDRLAREAPYVLPKLAAAYHGLRRAIGDDRAAFWDRAPASLLSGI